VTDTLVLSLLLLLLLLLLLGHLLLQSYKTACSHC
jgi:hypothetical protein